MTNASPRQRFSMPSVSKLWLLVCTFAVFIFAVGGIEFARQPNAVAIIWPSDAILLAIILRSRREAWPALIACGYIGNFAAELIVDPVLTAALLSACNVIEITITVLLFVRFVKMPPNLTHATTFAKFLLICGLIGPAISAVLAGNALAALNGIQPLPIIQRWFAADFLGAITILPLLLMLKPDEWHQIARNARRREAVSILLLVLGVSAAIFTLGNNRPILFLVFPFLILAAFRLRFLGAAMAMAILAMVSIPLTIMGYGPFSQTDNAPVLLQIFLATCVFTIMPVAAVLTERDRLERVAVVARGAAEQASAAKSAFLANMSHELRTPMTGIMGMCDLLLASQQTPEQKNITETLERSARSFLELLNDLLDLAKIEAGRMDIDTTDFRLSLVMKDVLEFFAPAMSQKGLTFTVEWDPTRYDVLNGDPKRLRQILFNLVGNALKFTDSGGVSVTRSQVLQNTGLVLTSVEVRDTGVGISPEVQGRLFHPFVQEDNASARGGAGLGLNICRQIVQAMGGSIGMRSSPGEGSRFSFSVPLLAGLEDKIQHRFAITPARIGDVLKAYKLKILLAEDNVTTQFLVKNVVEMWGHHVTVVENGAQALARTADGGFDMILMDMQMPVMDGREAVRLMRAREAPGRHMPIIALTADAILESRARYLEAGCDAIVTKPIAWTVLVQAMKALLSPGEGNAASLPGFEIRGPAEQEWPVFDRERIDGLTEGLGSVLMSNLLARCLDSLDQYTESVLQSLADGDFAGVKRFAHDLKSVCAQFGALRASEIARRIEAEMPDLETVKAIIPELKDSVEAAGASIQAIQENLSSQPESGPSVA